MVAQTEALLIRGATTEEIVRELRNLGFGPIESLSALVKAAGLSFSDAEAAVIESPIWADQRDKVVTVQRIDPPEPPDAQTLTRLRATCRSEPRIAEAWVTGSRVTRSDGSFHESTDIALVLDPPFSRERGEDESRAERELLGKLDAAAPTTGRRGWVYVSKEAIAHEKRRYLKIYVRAATP